MDVSKLPPTTPATNQPDTPPSKERLVSELVIAESQDLGALEKIAPAADRADIRPLDVPGGLQILLAETRSAFELIAESIGPPATPPSNGESNASRAVQVARQIVELLLQSLPEDAGDPAVWTSALVRAESALDDGQQLALSTVSNWREVPAEVVVTVQQSAAWVRQALSDELPNPLWLRPEWVGLAPRLQRFARRRRAARRRLTDPDHWQGGLDEHDEQRR